MTGAKRRVVVTGLGPATPIGLGVTQMWEALLAGRSGVRRIESFDPSGFASQVAAELPDFKFGDFIPKTYRKSAKVMARDILIAVVCAYHATKDAGLRTKCLIERGEAEEPRNLDSTRFGANIGAGLICADLEELASALASAADENGRFDLLAWGAGGMENLTPLWLLKFLPNMLACHVTIVHDAQAPSNTITCGEASSHLAIGEAFRTIACGDADVCICGGAESKVNPMALARPHLLGRLAVDSNSHPEQACRPFAQSAGGMVVSEGGGLVILESLEHALGRNARIYAEVVGFGAGANVQQWERPDSDGAGLARAMKAALVDAHTSTADIDLVNPFGSGVAEIDASELATWTAVFGDRLETMPAFTSRGALGNNGAGTGAIDFAATVMALHHNTIPVTLNTRPARADASFKFAESGPQDAPVTQAMSVGYAYTGGQTAALIIRKFEE